VIDHNIRIGKYIAIDCEAVGIGPTGKESALARVSIVNFHGKVILDKYVNPGDCITDYRTEISGITRELLVDDVQKEVSDIIKGRIIVGHSLNHDLKLLSLCHPQNMIRDSSLHRPFLERYNGKKPSLKTLAKAELNIIIQEGEHSSVQDAQTSMRLFLNRQRKKYFTVEDDIKERILRFTSGDLFKQIKSHI
ncbi:5154_t:CDS:2, partial [Entrophospora sp. SA101]